MISKDDLRRQLAELGIKPGGVLLVHTAFSKVKPVEDGVLGMIETLEAQLGPQGTLVMPSMSYDDEQVFDPATTPCKEEVGVVADTFWRLSHVRRGDNAHAFAASGAQAALITAPSPLDVPHGLNSAVGRVYSLDGQVLLLGIGHDANTTIHLAENLADVRYRLDARLRILKDGQTVWFEFAEVNHCCQNFHKMDIWLDVRGLQRRGQVGHAESRLFSSKAIVETALEHLKLDETVFLHPRGMDEECDSAWESLNR